MHSQVLIVEQVQLILVILFLIWSVLYCIFCVNFVIFISLPADNLLSCSCESHQHIREHLSTAAWHWAILLLLHDVFILNEAVKYINNYIWAQPYFVVTRGICNFMQSSDLSLHLILFYTLSLAHLPAEKLFACDTQIVA